MQNPAPSDAQVAVSDLWTADEVGRRLRLPLSTVYYLAKTGRLPAVRFGRSWRFPGASIERLGHAMASPAVLVVDDDGVTRAMVSRSLGPCGWTVWEAESAERALQICRRQRFAALLVDLKLPGRSGTELIRELLGAYSLHQMVVITAYPDDGGIAELLDLGPMMLLRKPFSREQLVECVKRTTGSPTMTSSAKGPGLTGEAKGLTATECGGLHSRAEARLPQSINPFHPPKTPSSTPPTAEARQ